MITDQNIALSDQINAGNVRLANQINAGNVRLANQVAASTEALSKEIAQVGGMVAESLALTMQKLDQLDANIAQVGQAVNIVNANVCAVAMDLAELRQSFYSYVEEDRRTQAIQQATSDIANIKLDLEKRFGSHAKIRANTVGILRARDLGVVRTNTIIEETEKNLLNASDYWLASALISLAYWIESSTGKEGEVAKSNAAKALNEAYRLDRQKTSLLFGLINLRADKRDEAARWFGIYLSFQSPEKVDHTMTLLLNVCSSGVLVGTEANDLVIGQMVDWINEVDNSTTRSDIIAFWKQVSFAKCEIAPTRMDRFSGIKACCPGDTFAEMSDALKGSYLHGIMRNDIEATLAARDLVEEDTWARIDEMLYSLVGNFAGEEMPLRREYEYRQLIIDLGGDVKLASQLRSIKKEILTETKTFIDVMNHAACDKKLTSASAATAAMATRLEMPWIKEAYVQTSRSLVSRKPVCFPIVIDDFGTTSDDGTDEKEIVARFKKHVDDKERAALAAAAAKPLHMVLGIGGAIVALIGIIMMLAAGNGNGALLFIIGIVAAVFGIRKIMQARRNQDKIKAEFQAMLRNGVIVLREVCSEIREWIADFEAHQADRENTETYMDQIIQESIDAATFAAASR